MTSIISYVVGQIATGRIPRIRARAYMAESTAPLWTVTYSLN